jgi:hypothetical protein
MYYSTTFKSELHSSRFDRWRVNYELLLRVLEAKENQTLKTTKTNGTTILPTTHRRTGF